MTAWLSKNSVPFTPLLIMVDKVCKTLLVLVVTHWLYSRTEEMQMICNSMAFHDQRDHLTISLPLPLPLLGLKIKIVKMASSSEHLQATQRGPQLPPENDELTGVQNWGSPVRLRLPVQK